MKKYGAEGSGNVEIKEEDEQLNNKVLHGA